MYDINADICDCQLYEMHYFLWRDLPIEFSEYTFYKFLVVDFYEKMFKTETQLSLHDYKNAEKLSEQI